MKKSSQKNYDVPSELNKIKNLNDEINKIQNANNNKKIKKYFYV